MAGGEKMLPYTVRSHRGLIRKTNEDRYYIPPEDGPLIFAVADGLGGYAAGEVASALAVRVLAGKVEKLLEDFEELDCSKAAGFFDSVFQEANREIVQAQQQQNERKDMGTTLTAAFIKERQLMLAHVGDSQAFILRGEQMIQLTEDHSLVMELVKNGEIDIEEAYTHPQRHIITRFLGTTEPFEVDFYNTTTQAGDHLILCTDGLTSMLRPSEIGALLVNRGENDLEQLADELLSRANAQGGSDNITFALISL